MFLLDSNIAIHARDGSAEVIETIAAQERPVTLSALSLAELERGVARYPEASTLRRERLEVLLENIPVLPFGEAEARCYGRIIAQLGWVRGRDFDRMIAAHAMSVGATLVTDNLKDFEDIPGLLLVNWRR